MSEVPWYKKTFEEYLASMGMLDSAEYERRLKHLRNQDIRRVRRENLERSEVRITRAMADKIVWDMFDATDALVAVRVWLEVANKVLQRSDERDPVVLIIAGSKGIGKTVAGAYALAHEGGSYVLADQLPDRIFPSKFQREHIHKRLEGRLVFVDDVGTERHKDFDAALFELIDTRVHKPGALTLITSNLSQAQFQARYDSRTIDRLIGAGEFIEFVGESLRGLRGKAA